MEGNVKIGLDYSHDNKLTLEATSYSEFTQFLVNSGFRLGKIQAGFDSIEKIEAYDAIILSSPINMRLNPTEIGVLEKYVKKGGSLLIMSSGGGDFSNQTNLNELTCKFGFEFEPDQINDSMSYINLQKRPLLTDFKPHLITENLKKVVFSSACSLKILDFIVDEKNVKIDEILRGGLNCWRKKYDGKDWVEEDCPKKPLITAIEYYKGKVVSFGCLSIFSSLGHEYGFTAFENNVLIANILNWLTTSIESKGKVIIVNLDLDLFYWADGIMKKDGWNNMSDLINVGLKHFKNNYKEIIQKFQEIREEKLKRKQEYESAPSDSFVFSRKKGEDKVLDLIPARDPKALEDIMSALEDLTGEKYEISIDLRKKEKESVENEKEDSVENEIVVEEKKELLKKVNEKDHDTGDRIVPYTVKDIEKFEKESFKKAIWRGSQTVAFKKWLEKKK